MVFFCAADLHHMEDISASHDGTMLQIVAVLFLMVQLLEIVVVLFLLLNV